MRCLSASSTINDPFRAGAAIGEKLAPIAPEVVLVFFSINYSDRPEELLAGLRETLGPAPLLCGGSGDGVYETGLVAHHGVTALGCHAEGHVRWRAVLERGVGRDTTAAAHSALSRLRRDLGAEPDVAFVLADGVKADGSLLADALAACPGLLFGGLAGDNYRFERSLVFAGDEIAEDAVLLLGAAGPLAARLSAASGWLPLGAYGTVESCEKNTVRRIAGRSALEFVKAQSGKSPGEMDLGIVPLAEYTGDDQTHFALRSPLRIDPASGAMTFFGRIAAGSRVRVCHADRAALLDGVDQALAGILDDGFTPAAALVVSCAGRKWLLANPGFEELRRVQACLGADLPLIGLPSFGEISPFRMADGRYSRARFHNVTFVVCLLGR